MDFFLFGDQTASQYQFLKRIIFQGRSPVLRSFLEQVAVALRWETDRLPKWRRESVPDFLTLSELVERYSAQQAISEELESSLITLTQLAHYIG